MWSKIFPRRLQKQSSTVVADELVYYPSVTSSKSGHRSTVLPPANGDNIARTGAGKWPSQSELSDDQRPREVRSPVGHHFFTKLIHAYDMQYFDYKTTSTSVSHHAANKSSDDSLSSLEQLRLMYNSAPDFARLRLDEEDEEEEDASKPVPTSQHRSIDRPPPVPTSRPPQHTPPCVQQQRHAQQLYVKRVQSAQVHNGLVRQSMPPLPPTDNSSTYMNVDELRARVRVPPTAVATEHSPTDSGYRSATRAQQLLLMTAAPSIQPVNGQINDVDATANLNVFNDSVLDDSSSPILPSIKSPLPYTEKDIVCVLQRGRCGEHAHAIGVDVVARVCQLMQRVVQRIIALLRRLCTSSAYCSRADVETAVTALLSVSLGTSCTTAAARALQLYAMETDTDRAHVDRCRYSRTWRARLHVNVARVHRWAIHEMPAICVNEQSIIYLTSTIECLVEELVLGALQYHQSHTIHTGDMLTAHVLDAYTHTDTCFYGLLLPHAHLLVDRNADGASCQRLPVDAALMTTCVPSRDYLDMHIVTHATMSARARDTLYYYTQCSSVSPSGTCVLHSRHRPTLQSWLRVAGAFARHNGTATTTCTINDCHVLEAASLIVSNVKTPPISFYDYDKSSSIADDNLKDEQLRQHHRHLAAFEMLSLGRPSLIAPLATELGVRRLNTLHPMTRLTPLMIACAQRQPTMVHALLDTGAAIDTLVDSVHSSLAGFSAVHVAVCTQNPTLVDALIIRGARLDGHILDGNVVEVESPLQLATMLGTETVLQRLLAADADAFSTSLTCTPEGYGYRRRGSVSALAIAAAYGRRRLVHAMLNTAAACHTPMEQPLTAIDFLRSESVSDLRAHVMSRASRLGAIDMNSPYAQMARAQQRALDDALYYASEHGHLAIAIELRNLGTPFTGYVWTQCLIAALAHPSPSRIRVIDALLDDACSASSVDSDSLPLLDDVTQDFIDDAIPTLFECCRIPDARVLERAACALQYLSVCQGDMADGSHLSSTSSIIEHDQTVAGQGGVIDARYVNNRELSDVTFTIDTRDFYAHRIVLVNASRAFEQLLLPSKSSMATGGSSEQRILLDGISYDVFEHVMQHVYNGYLPTHIVDTSSIDHLLEILSAAHQFELRTLVRHLVAGVARRLATNAETVDARTLSAIVELSRTHGLNTLLTHCEHYALSHMSALAKSTHFIGQLRDDTQFVSLLIGALTRRLQARADGRSEHGTQL